MHICHFELKKARTETATGQKVRVDLAGDGPAVVMDQTSSTVPTLLQQQFGNQPISNVRGEAPYDLIIELALLCAIFVFALACCICSFCQ